ncbi:MAG: stress response translation initiation inhibitor YciH [Candidatus Helarchaeales archaeon]
MEICPKCSLPKDLCMCEEIDKEENVIKVKVERRKYGRTVTLIEGIEKSDMKNFVNKLKAKCACGGTKKKDHIELQGDHRNAVREFLKEVGFSESNIVIQ